MRRKEIFLFLICLYSSIVGVLCLSLFCAKLLMTHDIYQNIERRKHLAEELKIIKKQFSYLARHKDF